MELNDISERIKEKLPRSYCYSNLNLIVIHVPSQISNIYET